MHFWQKNLFTSLLRNHYTFQIHQKSSPLGKFAFCKTPPFFGLTSLILDYRMGKFNRAPAPPKTSPKALKSPTANWLKIHKYGYRRTPHHKVLQGRLTSGGYYTLEPTGAERKEH